MKSFGIFLFKILGNSRLSKYNAIQGSMKIGFALIPASPCFDKIVNAKNKLHDIVSFRNKLKFNANIPHLTLFQGTFVDSTDYVSIANKLFTHYLEKCSDHYLHFESIQYVPHGWYFYVCKKTAELNLLHHITLTECKAHLILESDRLDRNLCDFSSEKIAGIHNYGYRYSADAFFPHVTLDRTRGSLKPEILHLFEKELSPVALDVPVQKLTLYKMGIDGAYEKTLYECQFN